MGECRWGVATRKEDAKEVPCRAVAAGADLWEAGGGRRAASVAETVAQEYTKTRRRKRKSVVF
jgi:hypothetical protein